MLSHQGLRIAQCITRLGSNTIKSKKEVKISWLKERSFVSSDLLIKKCNQSKKLHQTDDPIPILRHFFNQVYCEFFSAVEIFMLVKHSFSAIESLTVTPKFLDLAL